MTPPDQDPAREPEIATGTLAEIYAQQGLHERALEIYRRIRERRPGDAEIARRIAALEEAIERRDEEEPAAAPGSAADPDRADEASPDAGRTSPAASDEPGGAPPIESDPAFRDWLDRR